MSGRWTPLVALVVTLLPLLGAKRWITQRLRELSVRWVGDPDVALTLYFVILLPGVVIHELSHWLFASILGVRVRKLSLGPVRKGRSRRVSLGSIQVSKVDPLRASIIGLAPLLGGSAVILIIGNSALGMEGFAEAFAGQDMGAVWTELGQVVRVADFWLWLYLIFAVSNAMLPSDSDMAAVRPVLIFLVVTAALLVIVGGIPAMPDELVRMVDGFTSYLASAFAVTLAADAVFMLFIWLLTGLTRWAQEERGS